MSRADRLVDNPFFVLELDPDCSRMEIEREGQKLLAMLQIGFAGADQYATPFGPRPRTAELVRESMAELRDPRRRLIAELWARAPADEAPPAAAEDTRDEPGADRGWSAAMPAFGFGRRRR